EQPKNPYFREMKGEILLKANNPAAAAAEFKKAVALDPRKSSLMRMNYGRALMLTGNKANMQAAITELKAGVIKDPEFSEGYGYLAHAYGQSVQMGLADLATADQHYYAGKINEAMIFATRAQTRLKSRSANCLRAQDMINTTAQKR